MISFSPVQDTVDSAELPVQHNRTVPGTGNEKQITPVQHTYDIQSIIRQDSKSPKTVRVELRTDIETDGMIEDLKGLYGISRSVAIRTAMRLMHRVSETES